MTEEPTDTTIGPGWADRFPQEMVDRPVELVGGVGDVLSVGIGSDVNDGESSMAVGPEPLEGSTHHPHEGFKGLVRLRDDRGGRRPRGCAERRPARDEGPTAAREESGPPTVPPPV